MTNIWAQTFEEIRKPHFEMEDPYTLREKKEKEEKEGKPKRWWDDDGDGIGYEKGEVSGKFKKKKVEEGVECSAEDEKADKAGMKKYKMTAKEWEKSSMDKEADAKLAKKMKEEFIAEVDKTQKAQKKVDLMKGKNKVTINPQLGMKEEVEAWVDELLEEGYDLSEFTWDEVTEIYESVELYEAEGSYGRTPKATAAYGRLAARRSEKPATQFGKRGAKKTAVDTAVGHMNRSSTPDAGSTSKRSTRPNRLTSSDRKNMTPEKRTNLRGRSEYGHIGHDPDYHGSSGPGGMPKGKKLERQKKTGVSAESFDYFDEGTAGMPARGDAETMNVTDTQLASAKRRAAQAQISADMARIKLQKASMTKESVDSIVQYLSQRPDAFKNIDEGVFDPKKSKLRPASERTTTAMTDAQRKAAKKEQERVTAIHSKGETVLAGLRSSGTRGRVQTTAASKPAAPTANRKVKGRYDKLAKAASDVLKDIQNK